MHAIAVERMYPAVRLFNLYLCETLRNVTERRADQYVTSPRARRYDASVLQILSPAMKYIQMYEIPGEGVRCQGSSHKV